MAAASQFSSLPGASASLQGVLPFKEEGVLAPFAHAYGHPGCQVLISPFRETNRARPEGLQPEARRAKGGSVFGRAARPFDQLGVCKFLYRGLGWRPGCPAIFSFDVLWIFSPAALWVDL